MPGNAVPPQGQRPYPVTPLPPQAQPQAKPKPMYQGMKILRNVFGAITALTAVIGLALVVFGSSYETESGMILFISALGMAAIWGIWSLLIDISIELRIISERRLR